VQGSPWYCARANRGKCLSAAQKIEFEKQKESRAENGIRLGTWGLLLEFDLLGSAQVGKPYSFNTAAHGSCVAVSIPLIASRRATVWWISSRPPLDRRGVLG
jgi:hypothetical protein